jgi:hypothetical protein
VRTTAGAIGIRLSLRPLFSKEGEADANLGRYPRRENAKACLDLTSLRGALATKQSILSLRRAMDCFAEFAMTDERFEIEANNKHARRPGLAPGPITTGVSGVARNSNSVSERKRRGVWVPAQGRDDPCRYFA